jgi:hypothetical protein
MISPSKALLSIFHMHLFFSAPTGRMDMALGLRIVIASPRHPQSNHPADRHPSLPLAVTPPPLHLSHSTGSMDMALGLRTMIILYH